jgi:hypothetical protein
LAPIGASRSREPPLDPDATAFTGLPRGTIPKFKLAAQRVRARRQLHDHLVEHAKRTGNDAAGKLADKLWGCHVHVRKSDDWGLQKVAKFCRQKVCPWCAYALASRDVNRLRWILIHRWRLSPPKGRRAKFLFVTLTRRARFGESCDEAIDALTAIWQRFQGGSWWRRNIPGGFYRREVKRTSVYWHAHLHVMMEMPETADPKTGKQWTKKGLERELRRRWRAAGGGRGKRGCFVEAVAKGGQGEAATGTIAEELVKRSNYMTKEALAEKWEAESSGEPVSPLFWPRYWAQWALAEHGRRHTSYLGAWRGLISRADEEVELGELLRMMDDPEALLEPSPYHVETDLRARPANGTYRLPQLAAASEAGDWAAGWLMLWFWWRTRWERWLRLSKKYLPEHEALARTPLRGAELEIELRKRFPKLFAKPPPAPDPQGVLF